MAERLELELPNIGSVRNHVTDEDLDFIYQGKRQCARFYPLWVPMEKKRRVINVTHKEFVHVHWKIC